MEIIGENKKNKEMTYESKSIRDGLAIVGLSFFCMCFIVVF